MRRLLPIFLAAVVLLSACGKNEPWKPPTPVPDPPVPAYNACGTVVCDGSGIGGVVVSDGEQVTVTDDKGGFRFNSTKKNGYVFISVPSGYEVASDGVLPRFFARFAKGKNVQETFEFQLKKVDQSSFNMLFFGDMHLADRAVFKDLVQFRSFTDEVNAFLDRAECPTYAMSLGDMAWDVFWTQNGYTLQNYLEEVNDDFGDRLQIFHTMGNHDNDPLCAGDFACEDAFRRVLGPTYYSFNVGGVHFIVLDDIECRNDGSGERSFSPTVVSSQAQWLQKDLSHVAKTTPLVLTMHSPLYRNTGDVALYNGYGGLIKYLSGYSSTFVTGHTHILYNVDRTYSSISVYEANSGAVCAAWWVTASNSGIHLSGDGAPGGYRVMSVTPSSTSSYFKGTGLERTVQMRTYDRNSICLSAEKWVPNADEAGRKAFLEAVGDYSAPSSSNEVLINVWDWDPSWKVSVTENGRPLTVRQKSDVKDPLYLVCYEAYEYDHRFNSSVYYSAYTTNHMFSVTASAPDTALEITVTDRSGRSYSEHMTRPKPFDIQTYR